MVLALNGKSAGWALPKRNDVTREWLVTRHSRIQLQIAFASSGTDSNVPVGRGRTKNVSPRRF